MNDKKKKCKKSEEAAGLTSDDLKISSVEEYRTHTLIYYEPPPDYPEYDDIFRLNPKYVLDDIKHEDEKDLKKYYNRLLFASTRENIKYNFKCLHCGNKWEDHYTPSLCLNCGGDEIWGSYPSSGCQSCGGDRFYFGWICHKCSSIQVVSDDFKGWG